MHPEPREAGLQVWPFRTSVPAREHESCARRFAEVLERLDRCELALAEQHLQVLDVAEKVAERLTERIRKRKDGKAEDPPTPYHLILGRKVGS